MQSRLKKKLIYGFMSVGLASGGSAIAVLSMADGSVGAGALTACEQVGVTVEGVGAGPIGPCIGQPIGPDICVTTTPSVGTIASVYVVACT